MPIRPAALLARYIPLPLCPTIHSIPPSPVQEYIYMYVLYSVLENTPSPRGGGVNICRPHLGKIWFLDGYIDPCPGVTPQIYCPKNRTNFRAYMRENYVEGTFPRIVGEMMFHFLELQENLSSWWLALIYVHSEICLVLGAVCPTVLLSCPTAVYAQMSLAHCPTA